MAVDWSRGDLTHGLTVLQVDPTDLATVRNELHGVTGGKLELSYYGDTRMSAQLECVGAHGWDGTSALRLVHEVSDWTGPLLRETLFTGYVTDAPWGGSGDGLTTTFSLASTLVAWDGEGRGAVAATGLTVPSGAKALAAIRSIATDTARPIRVRGDATDYMFTGACVYEAGRSWLSIAMDLADKAGDRVTVDADGFVAIERYVEPSGRVPDWDVDPEDPRGLLAGEPSGGTDALSHPARVIVRSDSGDESVTGIASVPDGDPASRGVRGYAPDRFEMVSDLTPFTAAAATEKARQLLQSSSVEERTLRHGLLYRPLREGMVERWLDGGAGTRWQVSSAQLDFDTWTWQLDLKGGW